MSEWLDRVLEDHGEACGNCGEWRILHRETDTSPRLIETCSNCGDEAFDIYEVATTDGP